MIWVASPSLEVKGLSSGEADGERYQEETLQPVAMSYCYSVGPNSILPDYINPHRMRCIRDVFLSHSTKQQYPSHGSRTGDTAQEALAAHHPHPHAPSVPPHHCCISYEDAPPHLKITPCNLSPLPCWFPLTHTAPQGCCMLRHQALLGRLVMEPSIWLTSLNGTNYPSRSSVR